MNKILGQIVSINPDAYCCLVTSSVDICAVTLLFPRHLLQSVIPPFLGSFEYFPLTPAPFQNLSLLPLNVIFYLLL